MADLTVRRLVALLGHLTPDARIPISDLAERVGTTESQLASDLLTLSVCGVAPYYPGDLMPLIVEDGYVEVFGELPAISGTVRLSAAEAKALATALQTAGFTADEGLPARLLAASATDAFDAETLEHTIRTADAAHNAHVYEALASALDTSDVVRIEYIKAGSEEPSTRDVEPVALFAERGAWYLTAWCRRAGDWRTFRVDRIRSAEPTGERFAGRGERPAVAPTAFRVEGLPVATLRFDPGEEFSERDWPGARLVSEDTDGHTTVAVPYGGTEWIARRVAARLGRVAVESPEEVRAAVAELARAESGRY